VLKIMRVNDWGRVSAPRASTGRARGSGSFLRSFTFRQIISSSMGMFLDIPDRKPDGIKLIPLGDIATKDELAAIKGITAQDVLTSHRFPAVLAGIIPTNGEGGLGEPEKYDATYARNEVLLLCELIQDAINSAGLPRSLWVDFRENIGSTV
jgi:hypothetical protein